MNKNITINLPECNHSCLCNSCFEKVASYNSNIDINPEEYLVEMKYDIEELNFILKKYPSYFPIYIGMGGVTYVRRYNPQSKLEAFIMYNDDWYDNNRVIKYKNFIKGYVLIDKVIVKEF